MAINNQVSPKKKQNKTKTFLVSMVEDTVECVTLVDAVVESLTMLAEFQFPA
jgi:hypothetical protein